MSFSKFIPAALLLAGATAVLAQNGPPPGGPGGRPNMDPAARFKELDKNSDGKISLEEFQAMQQMGRMGGGQGGPPAGGAPPPGAGGPGGGGGMGGGMMMSAAERFKAADKNGDGSLSQDEFVAMVQGMRRGGGAGGAGGN